MQKAIIAVITLFLATACAQTPMKSGAMGKECCHKMQMSCNCCPKMKGHEKMMHNRQGAHCPMCKEMMQQDKVQSAPPASN